VRRLAWWTIAIVGLLGLGLPAGERALAQQSHVLTPSSGPPGTTVSIGPSPSNVICPLYLVEQDVLWDEQQTVGRVQGNPCTGWSGSFVVPSGAAPGEHRVSTRAGPGTREELGRFTVTGGASATATPSPSPNGANESSGVFSVRPDPRLCPSPLCGGYFITAVNQPATRCADRVVRESCYIASLDLSELGLGEAQLEQFRTALVAGKALVEGTISQRELGGFGPLGELRAQGGWVATTHGTREGLIFKVRDNGIRCIAAPCFSYDAMVVNSPERLAISDVDLSQVGASPEQISAAMRALSTSSLLVAGSIEPRPNAGPAGTGQTLVASEFYLPISSATMVPTATPTPGESEVIGGRGFGISSGSAGVALSWESGTRQSGYAIARLARGVLTIPFATLPATATRFTDVTAAPGLNCYALLVSLATGQRKSDLLCALVGFHSAEGAPGDFRLRLNQSTSAAFTWGPPVGGAQDGYRLVTLGRGTRTYPAEATSATGAADGFSCYALAALRNGAVTGHTDVECGLPGFSNLGHA